MPSPGPSISPLFSGCLSKSNQAWAKNAGALIVLVSKTTQVARDNSVVTNYSHSFDTGTAWGFFALEAHRLGYATHAMGGFDKDRARVVLELPDDYRPEAAIAIGRQGEKAMLSEAMQAREVPSPRLPQKDFVFEGGFPAA